MLFLETRREHRMLLLRPVATADAKEDKKRGRIGILLQYVLVGSSDLQLRGLMGKDGILASNGFE